MFTSPYRLNRRMRVGPPNVGWEQSDEVETRYHLIYTLY